MKFAENTDLLDCRTEFDDIALTHRFIEAVTTNLVQSQKQATKDISFKNQVIT